MTDLVVYEPPQLFPDTPPEERLKIAAQWVREQGGDPRAVSVTSISGKLIAAQWVQWAQSFSLQGAFKGALTTPQAQEVLAVFATGTPISLRAYGTFEKYAAFRPCFRKVGEGQYVAGLPPNEHAFTAASDYDALLHAQDWCFEQREKEILAARDKAQRMRDGVAKTSRLIIDLWEKLLHDQGLLLSFATDEAGELTDGPNVRCWMNGAHDMYAADGGNWAYGLECSSAIAVAYYVMALADSKERAAPVSPETGLKLVAPEGWARQADGSYSFVGGQLTPEGVLRDGQGRTLAQVVFVDAAGDVRKRGGAVQKETIRVVRVLGGGGRVVVESRVPPAPKPEEGAAEQPPQFLDEVGRAWAVSEALDRAKEKSRRQQAKAGS